MGSLGKMYAELLYSIGRRNVMVIHSKDGLDELSISSESHLWRVDDNGNVEHKLISPIDFGLKLYDEPIESLLNICGGTAEKRAENFLNIIEGKADNTPLYDFIILNSALALVTAGVTSCYKTASKLAKESISSGKT